MTAGDDCAVLVADGVLAGAAPGDLAGVPGAVHQAAGDGAVAQAGAVVGVATAGVTVGAVCVAGGDFQAFDLEALSRELDNVCFEAEADISRCNR